MSEEGVGAGRARGRARGRPPTGPSDEEARLSPGSDQGSGNGGNGDGAALRGRGGFRTGALNTIPSDIKSTTGEGGEPCKLYANFFRLNTPANLVVHQYHVEFEPNVEATRVRRGMMYDHKDLFNDAMLFDGMHDLKSTTELPDELTTLQSKKRVEGTPPVQITLKRVGNVQWGSFEMLRLYNTQVRRNLQHMKYLLVGRHFFDPTVRHAIREHRLEVWQGVMTAVNQHDGGILMVCDTVHKVIRADTVIDVLKEVRNKGGNFQENARRELSGSIVMTSYNNRTYKVDDICFDKNPTFEFERKGEKTTLIKYYKDQYQIDIRDAKQPLIQCLPSAKDKRAGKNEPLLLIPELCAMTGLTESLKSDFGLKKQMTQMTQAVPAKRITNLNQFIATMNSNPNVREEMQKWKCKFDDGLVKVPGRILAGERIYMAGEEGPNAGSIFQQRSGDFSKEIRSKSMRVPPKPIEKWIIIVSGRDRGSVDDFSQTLNRVCGPMGIKMQRPDVRALNDDRTGTFVEACRRVPPETQIVVIIVPNNNKERYDTIKKIFCIDLPIASQVIVGRTLSKKQMLMSVCTKIGIQMGAKLGGEPWTLAIPPKNLMVVGYDTYHDGTRRGMSVGGFVCSLNPSLSRYYSRVAYHSNHEEMSNNFALNFSHGLSHYLKINGKLPDRIVIFRDGVSDGQISHVYDYELAQVKDAIKKIPGSENVRLAFVIVTKRVNARFFEMQGSNPGNPSPGTIIDTVVTRLERYDFYLVSQSVRQGTVAPTCFNIIADETNWKPAHHQQLAYKLCHLYYNWMGTIRVPAPCQYAHKLAFLTGTALHREPSNTLADTLYYL